MALTQVSTDGVKDDAVTAGKIPANAVGSSELADNAVDTAAIADDAVTNAKLADSSVATEQIADDAVTFGKIQHVAHSTVVGRAAGSTTGTTKAMTAAEVRTILNVADGATYSNISGNVDHRVLTATGTSGLSQGEDKLTWNGNNLHIERTVTAYEQPLVNIYNSGAYGWGGAIRFSANWANTEEHQAMIKTYGGSSATGASLAFNVGAANSEKLRIQNGGGISFNGDTAAANALDDYEEGTWTPNIQQGSVTVHTANYTKIGRMVCVTARMEDFTNNSSGSSVEIGGLPFTPQVTGIAQGTVMYSYIGDAHRTVLYLTSGDKLLFYGGHGGAYDSIKHSDLNVSSGTTDIYFYAIYYSS